MSVTLAPPMFLQFMNPNNSGSPAAGFQLFTYVAGTTTPQATWTDSTETVQNPNPIILDANGAATVWGDPTLAFKFVLANPNDTNPPTSPLRTTDNFYFPLTSATVVVANYAITTAEITAGIVPTNFQYPPLDIRRYGADPTGTLPADNAMSTAIAVAKAQGNGGTIRAPAGLYTFGSEINLDSAVSIFIEGDGGANSATGTPTTLEFLENGGTFIFAGSSSGCSLRKLSVIPSLSTYSGKLIVLGHGNAGSDANFFSILDCSIGTTGNVTCTHLVLDKSINCVFERVSFSGGNPSVTGQAAAGGSYSNAMKFKGCQWVNCAINAVAYGGEAWEFDTCTFEGLADGFAGGFATITACPCQAMSFRNCWMGDVTSATTGTWITFFGVGLVVEGCFIGNSTSGENISLNSAEGVTIAGNYFFGANNCIGFDGGTCGSTIVTGNHFKSVTNIFGGNHIPANLVFNPNTLDSSPGAPIAPPPGGNGNVAANGYLIDANGVIEQWGTSTATSTTLAVTLGTDSRSVAFPTACWNVQLTPGSQNYAWWSSKGTSGFTINLATTGTTVVDWRTRGI